MGSPSIAPVKIAAPPPETWAPARKAALALVRPIERFLSIQAASGIILLLAAVVAMVWANSPWKESYHHLWHTPLVFGVGDLVFKQSLHFWINDGLMVIFFFVVGLEIRREMHQGELSEIRRATLPIAAAIGGMVVPAALYLAFNTGKPGQSGWGVPMATDIAFAVGILTLLGSRVPAALRVLLLALAIIDDIGAILVIALFYSSGINLLGFALAAAGVVGTLLMQRIGLRKSIVYVVPGIAVWAGMLTAGVHPTIAGVIMGLITPVRPWFGQDGFLKETQHALEDFERKVAAKEDAHALMHPLERVEQARREAVAPVVRLEVALHPWVAYGIMPVFALANAGVTLGSVDFGAAGALATALGITLGLALGKPLGIVLASVVAVKLGLCSMPRGVDLRGMLVVGAVGGIGFTMALFIAQLAFSDPATLGIGKVAVLIGSLLAGIVGVVAGLLLLPRSSAQGAAQSVYDAERSTDL
ncbi:MAG: Na+/H+ antiporter NhaA [Polyangiaceae bacterium]